MLLGDYGTWGLWFLIIIGLTDYYCFGIMVLKDYDSLGLWFFGIIVIWNYGSRSFRN